MATEAYFVSPDGTHGQYVHLTNNSLQEARQILQQLWGQPPLEVPDRAAMNRTVRTPGPSGTDAT